MNYTNIPFLSIQVLACLAKNLLLFEFGLSMAFPTILIPALSGLNEKYEISENLLVTPTTATWLGKENRTQLKHAFST